MVWNKSAGGELGEDIAVYFLQNKGFSVLERNYHKKVGEIDIIAQKNKSLYFFEVKMVTHEIYNEFSRETLYYRPEERVNREKLRKIAKTAELYLLENRQVDVDFFIGVVSIIIDPKTRKAHCRLIENIL